MFDKELTEEELFFQIGLYSPVACVVNRLLIKLRMLWLATREPDVGALKEDICRDFLEAIRLFGELRDKLLACGIGHFPSRLFVQLSPAFHWLLKRVRRILPPSTGDRDPLSEMELAFEDFKKVCWPDTRPDNLTDDEIRERMNRSIDTIRVLGEQIGGRLLGQARENEIRREKPAWQGQISSIEERVVRMDNRERREVATAAVGGHPTPSESRSCLELWQMWSNHPEWIRGLRDGCRVTKRQVFEELTHRGKLPRSVTNAKVFVRAIAAAYQAMSREGREVPRSTPVHANR